MKNDKLMNIIKSKHLIVNGIVLKAYQELNLTEKQVLLLSVLLTLDGQYLSIEVIKTYLPWSDRDILIELEALKDKKILAIQVVKNQNNISEEIVNFDLLWAKLLMQTLEKEIVSTEKPHIFSVFEQELGKPLSPMEIEVINGWLEAKYSEEIILGALKEAVLNGVNSLRYIDKILFEWQKKGLTNPPINKKRPKNEDSDIEPFDYDWLNE